MTRNASVMIMITNDVQAKLISFYVAQQLHERFAVLAKKYL